MVVLSHIRLRQLQPSTRNMQLHMYNNYDHFIQETEVDYAAPLVGLLEQVDTRYALLFVLMSPSFLLKLEK